MIAARIEIIVTESSLHKRHTHMTTFLNTYCKNEIICATLIFTNFALLGRPRISKPAKIVVYIQHIERVFVPSDFKNKRIGLITQKY